MKLAYSTNAYTRTNLIEALGSIAELGFAGAEILCDVPHWYLPGVRGTDVECVRSLLHRTGLGLSNLNANTANGYFTPPPPESVFEPSLSSANPEFRRWRTQYSIQAVRLAAALGVGSISVTSGLPGSGGTPKQGLRNLSDSLCRICEVAEQHGVRVGIEYEPGLLVERSGEVADLIHEVGSPALGVNLDLGHAYLAGEGPDEVVTSLAGRIWNVHIEDIAHHKHFHLIPGDGEMPLERYIDALRSTGYDGYLTLELYTYPEMPDAAGRRALSHLRALLVGDSASA